MALAASVVAALAVTWYLTRLVQRLIAAVAHSASQLAEGRHGSRVPNPGLGLEFDQLAGTINDLAKRLSDVEVTRRRILADLAHEMRTPPAMIVAHLEVVEDCVRVLDATPSPYSTAEPSGCVASPRTSARYPSSRKDSFSSARRS